MDAALYRDGLNSILHDLSKFVTTKHQRKLKTDKTLHGTINKTFQMRNYS